MSESRLTDIEAMTKVAAVSDTTQAVWERILDVLRLVRVLAAAPRAYILYAGAARIVPYVWDGPELPRRLRGVAYEEDVDWYRRQRHPPVSTTLRVTSYDAHDYVCGRRRVRLYLPLGLDAVAHERALNEAIYEALLAAFAKTP